MIKIIIIPGEKVLKALVSEMKKMKTGVVVLLTKPFSALETELKKSKINLNNFVFIDAVGTKESERVIPISIKNLTALSIAISDALQTIPSSSRNILFDSVSAFLVYHNSVVLQRFLIFTLTQMRQVNANTAVLFSKETKDNELLLVLQQSSDSVIK